MLVATEISLAMATSVAVVELLSVLAAVLALLEQAAVARLTISTAASVVDLIRRFCQETEQGRHAGLLTSASPCGPQHG